MWKYKLIGVALFLKAITGKLDFESSRLGVPQNKKYYDLEKVARISAPENSGLTEYHDSLFFIVDSGGEPAIYKMTRDYIITDTINVLNASNRDWESLTIDDMGTFYVGDFGNNLNRRKDLKIYKFNQEKLAIDTLSINYAHQNAYPPPKKEMNFDCEAFFWNNGKLHLFSKNRGSKCVRHYVMEDIEGHYALTQTEELKLNHMITGADISPDGSLVALLSYGKIYFFRPEEEKILSNPIFLIETTKFGQSEAITFISNHELVVTNEDGKVFNVKLSKDIPFR